MRADRQIYIAGLYAKQPSRGQPQADLLFGQLDDVLKKTGSDMRHLVKSHVLRERRRRRTLGRQNTPQGFRPRPPAGSIQIDGSRSRPPTTHDDHRHDRCGGRVVDPTLPGLLGPGQSDALRGP